MDIYSKRGVSAQKEEVHAAIKNLDAGLYPHAFCKIFPDYLTGNDEWVNIMHADGAGTKSILAYLYWKETGDLNIWTGIAQDAVVMNLDDLLCAGVYDNILFSSTIDRNKTLIPGSVLEKIISGTQHFFDFLKEYNIHVNYLGGETADVGDVVRTIAVNGTMMARWPKAKLVTNDKIAPGNVIVGFASFGKATYENAYNSGIGSNGLTSARHDVLHKFYAENYPETFEPALPNDVVYVGKHRLTDAVTNNTSAIENIGKLILSPTRTYAPLMVVLLKEYFDAINGIIHCSGGGQTKCLKYLPGNMRIVKDNLFDAPEIFRLIQQGSGADDKEMYQVFNMGHRLEIFTDEASAKGMIEAAAVFNIDAQIIGHVEECEKTELKLKANGNWIEYYHG